MEVYITKKRVFGLLADMLEYPQPGLAEAARECAALLAGDDFAAAACLHAFRAFVEEMPRGRLEEIYTSAFDLDAAWYPYIGYHLFGESYRRSVFMLELNERYRAHRFPVVGELPDCLSVLLRFLAVCDDPVLAGEIVHEALLPVLDRMDQRAGEQDRLFDHPYRPLLQALRLVLHHLPATARQEGDDPHEIRPTFYYREPSEC